MSLKQFLAIAPVDVVVVVASAAVLWGRRPHVVVGRWIRMTTWWSAAAKWLQTALMWSSSSPSCAMPCNVTRGGQVGQPCDDSDESGSFRQSLARGLQSGRVRAAMTSEVLEAQGPPLPAIGRRLPCCPPPPALERSSKIGDRGGNWDRRLSSLNSDPARVFFLHKASQKVEWTNDARTGRCQQPAPGGTGMLTDGRGCSDW